MPPATCTAPRCAAAPPTAAWCSSSPRPRPATPARSPHWPPSSAPTGRIRRPACLPMPPATCSAPRSTAARVAAAPCSNSSIRAAPTHRSRWWASTARTARCRRPTSSPTRRAICSAPHCRVAPATPAWRSRSSRPRTATRPHRRSWSASAAPAARSPAPAYSSMPPAIYSAPHRAAAPPATARCSRSPNPAAATPSRPRH